MVYLEDAKWRRSVGLPKQPFLNLVNTENLGVEAMESAPTDSSRSSPVRVTESPGRGSVSKRENPKIVTKEYSKVDAVLEVRKVFGSPIKLDVSARSAAARERSAYNNYTWSKSGNKHVKTFAKPKNVVGIRQLDRKPAKKEAIVRHDVKLSRKACATTKNYKPAGRRIPRGKKLLGKKKKPIFSGTWEARKPSKAEGEVEAILKKISKIRKEADLMLAQPVKACCQN